MKITRRTFVKGVGAAGSAIALSGAAGCSDDSDGSGFARGELFEPYVYTGDDGAADLFQHGVASGDPLEDRVILWTRVTQAGAESVEVYWEISPDPDMARVFQASYEVTSAARDFTVKTDVPGLAPNTTYYFRFTAMNVKSAIGRTRTAPAAGSSVANVRFATVSCASLAHGHFHSYRALAERNDIDVVLHLGDYIYEYPSDGYGNVRPYEPVHEIVTLTDYRTRHAQYKRDVDLMAVHQQHPFITIWDDHETADNSYEDGAGNHDENTEGTWVDRKNAAVQAYSEWMPIRDQENIGKIWRKFQWGDLFDLLMLDTRLWGRAEPFSGVDPALLGEDQFEWIEASLKASEAKWRILGQQVMFAPFLSGFNSDQWNGYNSERNRVLNIIEENDVDNVVVLTGDIHTAWAMDVPREEDVEGAPAPEHKYNPETGERSLAVEFVTTSVTSPGLAAVSILNDIISSSAPHFKWWNLAEKGFCVLDFTPERVHVDYYTVGDVTQEAYQGATHDQAVMAASTTNHVTLADAPAPERELDAPLVGSV